MQSNVVRVLRLVPSRKIWKGVILAFTAAVLLFLSTGSDRVCLTGGERAMYETRLVNTTESDLWGNAILLGGYQKPQKVFLTIGLPTVKRKGGSYIFSTLQSLINGSTDMERKDTVVVVSVNEIETQFRGELMKEMTSRFARYLDSGFIQVITAPVTYYPPLTSLKSTFGDEKHRVLWRSKQNLDYAFLIHYSHNLSQYYLQLEDDVITAPGYLRKMTSYIEERTEEWTMIDFSVLGFIGKLYKSADLPKLANLLRVFFNEQPCDFLLLHFLNLMLQRKRYVRIPTLFKHVGYHSSLENTTRDVNDVYFEGHTKIHKGNNPPAKLFTTIQSYDDNTIEKAYNNSVYGGFFWGKTPKSGDTISVIFNKPYNISRVVIETGLFEGKEKDRMHGAILESGQNVIPKDPPSCQTDTKLDQFVKAELDYHGENLNVQCLKVTVTQNHSQWLLIKEIAVFVID